MILGIPDVHLGHHNRAALRCVLRANNHYKPKDIWILGDMLDAHSHSSHPGTPGEKKAHYLRDEIEPARILLEELSKFEALLIYLEGNHEERVRRWLLSSKAAQDVEELVTPEALLARDNMLWVPYKGFYSYENWVVLHGASAAKDAARKHMDLFPGYSVMFGHTHRAQHVVRRDPITGRLIHGVCPGTLSELQPVWCKGPTTWTHGFVIIEDGTPFMVPIRDGKCTLPDGTKIDGNPRYGALVSDSPTVSGTVVPAL